jgi:RHS repeat-associated protein
MISRLHTYCSSPRSNPTPAAGNQAGRITRMQDASGVQEFSYGKLGEVIENVRTFVLPGASETYTFKMEWEYDSWNRIKQMTYPDGEVVSYAYDAASNIVAIGNSASALPNGLGGTYFNLYSYDSLYRLTSSQSWFSDYQSNPYSRTTQMQYSASGNIMSKSVNASLLLDGAVVNKNYTHQYTYNTAQPHTLASVGNSTFHWDLNGNMTRHDDRVLCWDEENRLGSARDPGHLAAYLYNAGGARVWKFTGDVSQMGQSGKTVIEQVSLNNKTLYASSFFVASDHGYTKHYFAGSERVCSKLGGGLLLAPVMPTEATVEAIFEDYEQMRNRLFDLINKFANCNPHPEQQTVTYIDIEPYLGGIQDYLDRHEPEENRFFYHPDHLGSSNFITDAAGDGYQHLQYLPFGETAVSQKLSWWSTPYQFTGKEKDDETGYNYFGARYYNSDISIWLSVDPLSDKLPSWSTYASFNQNPIKYVDPDGKFPIISSIIGFGKGLLACKSNFEVQGSSRLGNAFRSAWRHEKNAWKITGGLFTADKNKGFFGKTGQIASRFTWESPQTIAGLLSSYGANLFGQVEKVNYKAGSTVLQMRGLFGAMTLGSYIIGDKNIAANSNNTLFQHEFGHYLQSQRSGFAYLFKYGIPSLISAATNDYLGHNSHWSEQDANLRARSYWDKTIPNYKGWDNESNPISNNSKIINPKLWEYLPPVFPLGTTLLNLNNGR